MILTNLPEELVDAIDARFMLRSPNDCTPASRKKSNSAAGPLNLEALHHKPYIESEGITNVTDAASAMLPPQCFITGSVGLATIIQISLR